MYLTQEDVAAAVGGDAVFVELTDDDEDGETDALVVTALLTAVDAAANGYFRAGGYTVPVTSAQAGTVKQALLGLANFFAKTRGNREAGEKDLTLYEYARADLLRVAQGTILLDVPAEADVSRVTYEFGGDEPVFGNGKLDRYY